MPPRANPHPLSSPAAAPASPWIVRVAAGLLVLAAFLAYRNALDAPFVFDDRAAILDNPTIRQLWPLSVPLSPPADGRGVGGRPLVNLSLAINYAVGGTGVRGYHLTNVALHAAAALVLFGLVRRTLARTGLRPALAQGTSETCPTLTPTLLAFTIALLWALHPLQTESVTCVIQRTEILGSLFLLLTLYCFARGAAAVAHRRIWFALSILACLAGVASKEIAATAPLLVFFYDRAFVSGTFGQAWRRHRGLYAALVATWLLLAWLMLSAPQRGGTVGFGLGVSPWHYALTQVHALTLYLKLALWPHPLVVDYGPALVTDLAPVLWRGLLLVSLVAVAAFAWWRWPRRGFLGAWFFVILAPSSSIVPLASQTIAEHRMYLPLAAIVAGLVVGLHTLGGRRAVAGLLALAVACGWLTARRNAAYRNEIVLWTDTAAHAPQNHRAHTNLGNALLDAGRIAEAIAAYDQALLLQPQSPDAQANLSLAYLRAGDTTRAIARGETAVRLDPGHVNARVNLAHALVQQGRVIDAIAHFQEARRLQPDAPDIAAALADAHFTAGNQAAARQRFGDAIAHFRSAVLLVPAHLAARNNLANALLVAGQVDAAIAEYREVLRQRPDDRAAQDNLAQALQLRGPPQEPVRATP